MMDNYDLWEAHDRAQAAYEARLPVCDKCHKRITGDDYFDIEGEILCEDCMNDKYRRSVEDYCSID